MKREAAAVAAAVALIEEEEEEEDAEEYEDDEATCWAFEEATAAGLTIPSTVSLTRRRPSEMSE